MRPEIPDANAGPVFDMLAPEVEDVELDADDAVLDEFAVSELVTDCAVTPVLFAH